MGGMADCGVGLDSKTSPRCAAIEKAQDDLRYPQSCVLVLTCLVPTRLFLCIKLAVLRNLNVDIWSSI